MKDLKTLEYHTKKFIEEIEATKSLPLYKLSIPEARAVLDHLQSGQIEKRPTNSPYAHRVKFGLRQSLAIEGKQRG